HHAAERQHLAVHGPGVIAGDVFGLRSELLIGLDVDAVRTVVEVEIIHVRRSEQHLHRFRHIAQRQPQALRPFTVDVHEQLWIVRGDRREYPGDARRRIARGDELIGRTLQVFDRPAALIEELVGEAAELTQTVDRRRQKWKHHRAGYLSERTEHLTDDGLRGM